MILRIITIGKLKNQSLKTEFSDLSRRLSRFDLIELKEVKDKNLEIIKKKEFELIKPYLEDSSYETFLLWEFGKEYSTMEFSNRLKKYDKPIQFIITGAFGPSEELKKLVNNKLSLSKMTFTHEQALYMLIEQLYRVQCFEKGINYTK